MTQECHRCKQQLPQEAWHPGKWGVKGTYCRECFAQYKRERRTRKPRARLKGDLNGRWAGDEVGYGGLHERVRCERGPASNYACACGCGQRAHDWAYDHTDPDERLGFDHGHVLPYSLDVSRYQPMTVACHRAFDREARHGRRRQRV